MKSKTNIRKSATKDCPNCGLQIPVATKTCGSCRFIIRKLANSSSSNSSGKHNTAPGKSLSIAESKGRRKTERVRRSRPDFYNAMEFETPTVRKVRKQSHSTSSVSGADDGATPVKKRGRGRPRLKRDDETRPVPEKEVDMFANVSADKALQFSVILAEINRKYATQNFRPELLVP